MRRIVLFAARTGILGGALNARPILQWVDAPAGHTSHGLSAIPMSPINPSMTATAFELDGFRTVRNLGVVRGIIVPSRSIIGSIGAGLQTLIGGNITLLTELCEKTRMYANAEMLRHAAELGANAVIGVRYDATEIMNCGTEVLCYGTALVVEVAPKS